MDEWTEEDVGTELPCGCVVEHFNFECFRHYYPQTDCEDCAFGVPAVLHRCDE